MPKETVTIGGKKFEVECAPGEEHFLRAAASMLDAEATALLGQIGRLPESQMLLMAGLMLADKTAEAEDRARRLDSEMAEVRAEMERLRASPAPGVAPAVVERLSDLAARAEALADQFEGRG